MSKLARSLSGLVAASLLGAAGCWAPPPQPLAESQAAVPATVVLKRYKLESLQAQATPLEGVRVKLETDVEDDDVHEDEDGEDDTILPGAILKLDLDVQNKTKSTMCLDLTYYYPSNARFVAGSLELEGSKSEQQTVALFADRFVIRASELKHGKKIKAEFRLQVDGQAKAGDLLKNVVLSEACDRSALLARKTDETVGTEPLDEIVPASLPTLDVTHAVALDKGGFEALVGDGLTHTLDVANVGDVPADEATAELPIPDVARYVDGSVSLTSDYTDLNDVVPAPSSLAVLLGNLRGGKFCTWRSGIRRGAPNGAGVSGAARVASRRWGIDGQIPMAPAGGRPLVVLAPSLEGEPVYVPEFGRRLLAGGGLAGLTGFRIGVRLRNTGGAPADGVRVDVQLPAPFPLRFASPGFGSAITIPAGGEAFIYGDFDVPAEFANAPLTIGLSWESAQTLSQGLTDAYLGVGVQLRDGPRVLVPRAAQ